MADFKTALCMHDPRNPDGCSCVESEITCPGRTKDCACDNCFQGRDELALLLLDRPEPVVVAMALSLYAYNVDPVTRADHLYVHFGGECAELVDLALTLRDRAPYVATELAFPTAEVYVRHALERFGDQARKQAEANR